MAAIGKAVKGADDRIQKRTLKASTETIAITVVLALAGCAEEEKCAITTTASIATLTERGFYGAVCVEYAKSGVKSPGIMIIFKDKSPEYGLERCRFWILTPSGKTYLSPGSVVLWDDTSEQCKTLASEFDKRCLDDPGFFAEFVRALLPAVQPSGKPAGGRR